VDAFPRPLRRLPFALAAGPGVQGLDAAQFLHQLLLRPRLRRFLRFHGMRHTREMGSAEVNASLTHLAVNLQVSPFTQNQDLSALLFLYRELRERGLDLEGLARARTKRRHPVVMTIDAGRSRCGRAKAARIGARCCLQRWERSCVCNWRGCAECIARTLPRGMAG
jgi:hypothetical protein